jgi:DNA/RNA endonuclease YhcR with UshA esterase domain
MRTAFAILAIAIVVASGTPALAHHSVTAAFDLNSPLTLSGTISRIEWVNPHTYIYVDVSDNSGKVTTWAFESVPPVMMRRVGITKTNFGVGERVTIHGYHAIQKDKAAGFLEKVVFADGHEVKLFYGDPNGGAK